MATTVLLRDQSVFPTARASRINDVMTVRKRTRVCERDLLLRERGRVGDKKDRVEERESEMSTQVSNPP
jgi:hypothetical protein